MRESSGDSSHGTSAPSMLPSNKSCSRHGNLNSVSVCVYTYISVCVCVFAVFFFFVLGPVLHRVELRKSSQE